MQNINNRLLLEIGSEENETVLPKLNRNLVRFYVNLSQHGWTCVELASKKLKEFLDCREFVSELYPFLPSTEIKRREHMTQSMASNMQLGVNKVLS